MPRIRECHDGLFQGAIAERVVAAFHGVHAALGCGQPRAVYRRALVIAITRRGLAVTPLRVDACRGDACRGDAGAEAVRPDLIIESRVAVCLASAPLRQAAESSLRDYLEAAELELGLLLHFGTPPAVRRIHWQGGTLSAPPPSLPGPRPVPPRGAYPTP